MLSYFVGLFFSMFAILLAGATGASEHDPETQNLGSYLTIAAWLLSAAFFALAVWL